MTTIGFFPASRDSAHASTRIRCMQPLRWLWEHGNPDIAVMWDSQTPDIGVCFKKPLGRPGMRILDLCDNHLPAGGETARTAFLAAQEAHLCAVPTPTAAAALAGIAKRIEIIPDCIDHLSEGIECQPYGNFVLWYGCWGSKHHPGTGMRELLTIREWLDGKRLVICSNDASMAHQVGAELPASCHWSYVEWSPQRMRDLLGICACVIVPVTATEYTQCKSHNRVSTAINAGVPVLASHIPAYEEFGCTTDWSPDAEPVLVDKAKLAPYHIDVVGKKWKSLLEELAG